jgi:hypothetical protein
MCSVRDADVSLRVCRSRRFSSDECRLAGFRFASGRAICFFARSSMSVGELEARAAELSRQQADLEVQLRAAKRKLQSEQPKRCTVWMRAVAVKLLAASDFDDVAVRRYLQRKQRVDTVADVRAWHASLSPEQTRDLLTPGLGDQTSNRQLVEAQKFLAECRLVAWVQDRNEKKGIAPTAGAVLSQAGPSLARQRWRSNRYRWLQRLMRRWGGRRVRFAGGPDQLSPEDFERKACRTVLVLEAESQLC